MHHHDTLIPGFYHFGVFVEGLYFPNVESKPHEHDHGTNTEADQKLKAYGGEAFSRLLNITVSVIK